MKNRNRFLPSKLITSNDHTVTDEETTVQEFNNYFVNIGKRMADAIAFSSVSDFFTAAN